MLNSIIKKKDVVNLLFSRRTSMNVESSKQPIDIAPSFAQPAKEVRGSLRQLKILPTQQEAHQTFWGLKDRWWKQIIDGKDHKFGQKVFDDGLHGRGAEPGYLAGIEKACQDISAHFEDQINLDLYKSTHHVACSHFKGRANNTLMKAEEIDLFRNREIYCSRLKPNYEEWLDHHWKRDQRAKEISLEWEALDKNLNSELKKVSDKYHLNEAIAVAEDITNDNRKGMIFIRYNEHKGLFFDEAVKKVFKFYGESMNDVGIKTLEKLKVYSEIDKAVLKKEYQKEALNNIATVFAELEWMHPWLDGQGRTDLILLNFLLTQEGLNPVILEDPYFSTSTTIPEWTAYLEQGGEAWKKEHASPPVNS
jgi:Fic/DOC family